MDVTGNDACPCLCMYVTISVMCTGSKIIAIKPYVYSYYSDNSHCESFTIIIAFY